MEHQRPMLTRRAVSHLPLVAAVFLLGLSEVTRNMAVRSGHCDIHHRHAMPMKAVCGVCDKGSASTVRVAFPEISPATRLPPERWVWTVGVCVTFGVCVLPAAFLVGKVFHRAQELQDCFCCCGCFLYKVTFALLAAGFAGLLVEACVPLQEDIMVSRTLTQQSSIHFFGAGILFSSFMMHGLLVLGLQFCAGCSGRPSFTPLSLCLKVLMTGFVMLSMNGTIPHALAAACPHSLCDPCACGNNLSGLMQRCVVAGIALFCATYSLDIRDLQPGAGMERRQPDALQLTVHGRATGLARAHTLSV